MSFNTKFLKFRICLRNLFFALPNLKRFREKKDLPVSPREDPLKVLQVFFRFWNFQHICTLFQIYRTFFGSFVGYLFFFRVKFLLNILCSFLLHFSSNLLGEASSSTFRILQLIDCIGCFKIFKISTFCKEFHKESFEERIFFRRQKQK